MTTECVLPKLNNNDKDAEIIKLLVQDQQHVEKGQIIAEVETSKATSNLEAPCDGYIKLLHKKGDTVSFGKTYALIEASVEEIQKIKTDKIEKSSGAPSFLSEDPNTFRRLSKSAQQYLKSNAKAAQSINSSGLITKRMMEGKPMLNAQKSVVLSHRATTTLAQPPEISFVSEKLPRSKMMEINVLSQWLNGSLPSALTVQFASEPIRKTLKSMNRFECQPFPLIVYEMALLLKNFKVLNGFFQDGNLCTYEDINIGLAMDLGKGLKVPVIKNADQKTPASIASEINDLALKYLDNQLSSEELSGATVAITDLSGENILQFQPVLSQNQSMIIGVGGDSQAPSHPMTLTATFDHRVSSGREVGQFLNQLRERLISYGIQNLPELNTRAVAQDIACSRCMVDLYTLKERFGRQAVMYKFVEFTGEESFICHVCSAGF